MSLYLKYRPYDFSQVKGNKDTISSLEGLLDEANIENCPHTFLLFGQTGCGKTTVGRIIANKLGCVGEDFVEINSASFRGIDTIREIINNSQFMPIEGRCRVWLIDECHKLTNDAQNALLKILEDTPNHVYFILCTTEPQKLISTIKGRCLQLQLLPLNETELKQLLRRVAHKEGHELEDNVLDQIVGSSKGFPRNALQILEMVLAATPENRLEAAKKAEAEVVQSIELCRALAKKAPWSTIAKILDGMKDQDPEGIRRAVLGYCQSTLLKGTDQPLFGLIMEEFLTPTYDSGFIQITYACYSICKA